MLPVVVEPLPSALWRLAHLQIVHNHIVRTGLRRLPLAHIPAHRYVKQNSPVLDGPSSGGHRILHNRPSINVPHEPSTPLRLPIPSDSGPTTLPHEVVADSSVRHIWNLSAADQMLLGIFCIVKSPVQAGMVFAVAIPTLGDVDLTFMGPHERLPRQ
ncbi:hypothetical protein NUW58_g10663 [Xylaria curta]|uniref:Uncharacterized protein n=1 Tax=Xylaria curta TaxID=42375 RepID=A0ACC1MHD2_9PEZI|nr:hypothetical protein NUW58_g10663 [Xylaria curta]